MNQLRANLPVGCHAWLAPASHRGRKTVRPGDRPTTFDVLTELHKRRSLDELEALLAERLDQLRAAPPPGFPRD